MHSNEGEDSDHTTAAQADGAAGFSTLAAPAIPGPSTLGQHYAGRKYEDDPRRIEIAVSGSTEEKAGGEAWLAGKLLDHAAGMAGDAFLRGRELEATITVGERTATVKVSR